MGAGEGNQPELGAAWRSNPAASHLGITVAGFPNLFLLVGPNTGLGHNSIVFMIECQVDYIVRALSSLRDRKLPVLQLRADVQRIRSFPFLPDDLVVAGGMYDVATGELALQDF